MGGQLGYDRCFYGEKPKFFIVSACFLTSPLWIRGLGFYS